MDIQTPTTEQVAAICSERAARFPESATITMLGDRGVPVRLRFILGNPSQACRLPDKDKGTTWSTFIASSMKLTNAPDGLAESSARDCVLFPDMATYAKWCERWPALPSQVWSAVKRKSGAEVSNVDEVPVDDGTPEAVRAVADKFPAACLRSFSLRRNKTDFKILLLIDPPQSVAWRFFIEALRKTKVDHWALTLEMAQASVKLAYDEVTGKVLDLDSDVFAPWPGLALLATLIASQLAGVSAEVELGE